MTTSKFYNNVKSRLNKKGYRGFVKSDYIEAAEKIGVEALEDPTTEQINQAVAYLIDKQSKTLTVTETMNPTADEISLTATSDISEEYTEIQETDSESEMKSNFSNSDAENSTSLTTTQSEVKGMVNYKASLMGIQLAASEVDVIASKVDAAGTSFTETLNQIESALIAYVDYQQSREASEVDGMFDRVTRRVVEKNQSTINHLTRGINQFKTAMEVAEQHQKRELTSILNRLKVPS
ncbi:hypothetical protein SD81_017225 [Tolypothrix campylonemoides VB511288]|nr:hypothetical protein SD81_017225 [Tolypothrix campylonemoides VB511288]